MQLSYYHTGSSRSALPPCTPSSLGCHFHLWLMRFSSLKPHPQCVNWSCSRGNRERSSSGGPGTEDTRAENPSWWWWKMNGTGERGDRKLRKGKVEEEKTIRVWTVWSWGMQQEAEVAEWKRRATKRTPKSEGMWGRRKRKGGEEGGGREKKMWTIFGCLKSNVTHMPGHSCYQMTEYKIKIQAQIQELDYHWYTLFITRNKHLTSGQQTAWKLLPYGFEFLETQEG